MSEAKIREILEKLMLRGAVQGRLERDYIERAEIDILALTNLRPLDIEEVVKVIESCATRKMNGTEHLATRLLANAICSHFSIKQDLRPLEEKEVMAIIANYEVPVNNETDLSIMTPLKKIIGEHYCGELAHAICPHFSKPQKEEK